MADKYRDKYIALEKEHISLIQNNKINMNFTKSQIEDHLNKKI